MKTDTPLGALAELAEVRRTLEKGRGPALITGCIDSCKAYLAGELADEERFSLFVTYNETRAAEIAADFESFGRSVGVFPAKDLLFYDADVHSGVLERRRMETVKRLISGEKCIVVTSVDALLERMRPLSDIKGSVIELMPGEEIPVTELVQRLSQLGYERLPQAEAPGEFAVRGGIIDVYTLSDENPVRIELFGDEVDSLRSFDPETQRSLENLEIFTIYPAGEGAPDPAFDRSLLDYFPEDTRIFIDEPSRMAEKADAVAEEYQESMVRRLESGMTEEHEPAALFDTEEVFAALARRRTCALTSIDTKAGGLKYAYACQLQAQAVPSYQGHFENLTADLKNWKKDKARVILLAGSASRAQRLAGDLSEYGIKAIFTTDRKPSPDPGMVMVVPGNLKRGFGYPMIRFYVLTEGDLFGGMRKKKRSYKSDPGKAVTELSSLSVGDYVIHENHGLGIYQGTERIERGGIARDYMKITYGDGGNLYLPVTQMNLLQKYADSDTEGTPRLNRLGGNEWARTKTRVKSAVKEIAQELVALYSARSRGEGVAYSPDTVWQREFEEQFPYEETDDQIKAIEETKADMESGRIMDRLICGDVGFGKTEIAIRAAFKAVQDGKQVAYLVPTTILAQQHYNTFMQRLADYGPEVALLSRFRTPAEQKKTIEALRKGRVDIVIGTHRLLSKDVSFKDLGLLIIDEEQRFGVADKEKIKQMRINVDVLSLTATPIPRTLHMSLIGVRDMSLLRQAPLERMPIQTYVMEYNDEIVREAVAREIARGGQVYYVYNRVSDIAKVAARVSELVPDAVVAFAHGQMHEKDLEQIMMDFVNGQIDVLVSTTIVETGLDISNVNTMIIHDADRYGLAQLYQLRGRVGRSSRTAYAFMLYHRDRMLKEKAEKRLSAIREYTELGSGIRIAMRDLELRGAGNLLGAQQHGHMEAVGYDMYCKLLGDAVREIKGETKVTEDFETDMDISIDAYLPDEYVLNQSQRMAVYRRIAQIETEEEKDDVQDELIDRFGDIPLPAQNLLQVALLRAAAHEAYITEITGDRSSVRIRMYPHAPIDGTRVAPLLARYKGDIRVSAGSETVFTYTDQRKVNTTTPRFLESLGRIIADIGDLTDK